MSSRPNFIRLIDEICSEYGFSVTRFSDDWGQVITSERRKCIIVGYNFPLNKASSKELCQDKSLTYDVLNASGVPAAIHVFLCKHADNEEENLKICRKYLKKYGNIVLKDNQGTGGNRVYKASGIRMARNVLEQIHKISYGASLSPYYDILNEYRVVMLSKEPRVFIRKEREYVTGDGVKNVSSLMQESGRVFRTLPEEEVLLYVPGENEKVYLTWKHNLGQGAEGFIEEDMDLQEKLSELSRNAVIALDMDFCSVDIIETPEGLMVLEVNAGVMLEHFAGQSKRCEKIAKSIYRDAIVKSLNQGKREE